MGICLNCGVETNGSLCEDCRKKINIEELCNSIIQYTVGVAHNPNANPVWEKVAVAENKSGNAFKHVAAEIAEYLPSPRKEYQILHSYFGDSSYIGKENQQLLYNLYPMLSETDGLSSWERNRLNGLMVEVLSKEFQYAEAEEIVASVEGEDIPWQACYTIASYFINSRRYDSAAYFIEKGKKINVGNEIAIRQLENLELDNNKRSEGTKKEYLPQIDSRLKYETAMKSIGMDITIPVSRPKKIKEADYPPFEEKKEADFSSFVAYDFETTGFRRSGYNGRDSIIEVGAIKVVDGKIVETKDFIFQEFVRPYESVISNKITNITGITNDDVKDARQMWEVIPDFMSFVGDCILVGYNNVIFDACFLRRAGRYSGIIYTNNQFDVKRYLRKNKSKIGYDGDDEKLGTVAAYYGIENPSAHRALADAITTAKLFLKLKELEQ